MATKKRKKRRVFPEVEALQESRREAAASLAERVITVLGKEERERLRSLTVGVPSAIKPIEFKPSVAAIDWSSSRISERIMESHLRMLREASLVPYRVFVDPGRVVAVEAPPVINATQLENLKNTPAYKVRPEAPDIVEVITGWRAWSIAGGSQLKALMGSVPWPAREPMRASCTKNGSHLAPDWHCSCGIWAFKDVDKLVAGLNAGHTSVKIIGSVSLWGKVIETEHGYRAQYGYPSELWLLEESLEYLGLAYDVPVRKTQPKPPEEPTRPHYTLWLDEAAEMKR